MADNLTDAGESLAVSYLLGLVDEVRLMTANGSDATAGTEVTGGSYAAATGTTWASGANTSSISFAGMPACTVVGVELWDTAGTPTRILYGALTASKTVASGDSVEFAVGALTFTLA